MALPHQGQGLSAPLRALGGVPLILQGLHQQVAQVRFIIHDEDWDGGDKRHANSGYANLIGSGGAEGKFRMGCGLWAVGKNQ